MKDWLKAAAQNRDAALLLEVVGLLHDIGKMSDEFLRSQGKGAEEVDKFEHQAVVEPARVFGTEPTSRTAAWLIARANSRRSLFTILPDRVRDKLLTTPLTFGADDYGLAELLLTQAHGYNRGKRKGKLRLESEWYEEQGRSERISSLVRHLHMISHYEKEYSTGRPRSVEERDKQPYGGMYRATPFGYEVPIQVDGDDGLTAALRTLPLVDLSQVLTERRQDWLLRMRDLMTDAIADTRRPANEVTLWDWGYTVASFAKAALPKIVAEDWDGNWSSLSWRVLRVNLDIPDLLARSSKIGDVLGMRAEIQARLDKVKQRLEEHYAIANELYRDETGAYFVFPDLELPEELTRDILSRFPSDIRPLVHLMQAKISAGRLDPQKGKSQDSKREVPKLIAEPRRQACRKLKHPITMANIPGLGRDWVEARAEVCIVCGLRPVAGAQPAADQHLCRACFNRREGRAKAWLGKQGTTIWIDEATDQNARVALLVGRLGLEGWLDGSLESTVVVAEDDGTHMVKNPSPARLRRIVDTARRFWESALEAADDVPMLPQASCRRLEVRGRVPALHTNHAYELRLPGGGKMSVVWDGSRFISADNLEYVARQCGWKPVETENHARWLLKERFLDDQGSGLAIEEPVGYGGKNKIVGRMTNLQCLESDTKYRPFIPILFEPMWFEAVLPADEAMAAVNRIYTTYQAEMGKVRDRLPLSLGVVFFPRRTPLRAVIEAGRSMLAGFQVLDEKPQQWLVTGTNAPMDCEPGNAPPAVTVDLEKDGQRISIKVNLRMGDENTPDYWYPHWQLPDCSLKHACMLREGDSVHFRPSHFDFEFLDTTARRFEITYGGDGRRSRPTRPFLLDDVARLEGLWCDHLAQHLEKTQLHHVIGSIERARSDWFGLDTAGDSCASGVFRQFVHDTLAGAHWPERHRWYAIDAQSRRQLVGAGVSGHLADLADLHLHVLKEWGKKDHGTV